MARIQYRPASRSKGFRPQQLSTAGIARMREESNRLIQGMERRRRAEKDQRDQNLQAMKEDAAYTEQITRENNAIEMRNLENEGRQKIANIQGAQKQAQIDQQAVDSIIGSLVSFSSTAASVQAKKRKQELEDLTAEVASRPVSSYSYEEQEERIAAEDTLAIGGLQNAVEINANAVETNEDPVDTKKAHASNPGPTGVEKQLVTNRSFFVNGDILLTGRFNNSEKVFVAEDGTEFTGIQAKSDRYLSDQLFNITLKDLFKLTGVTDGLYVADAVEKLKKVGEVYHNQARRAEGELADAQVESTAKNIEAANTTKAQVLAFGHRMLAQSPEEAHTAFGNHAGTAIDVDIEVFRKVDFLGDGRTYDQVWPKRWAAIEAKRKDLYIEQQNRADRLRKAQGMEYFHKNIDSIEQAIDIDVYKAESILKEKYDDLGVPMPQELKTMLSEGIADNKEEVQEAIDHRIKYGTMDAPFVNSIRNRTQQKKAREAYAAQEERKYGPAALGIKKGFVATARKLTKINAAEQQGSAQTFMVQATLQSEYLKLQERYRDPIKALEELNKLVDAGTNGDKSSPFYQDTGFLNNRLVFPNIESSDVERQEKNNYIDKQILKHGRGAVDKPFVLADSNEMDAAYASSATGSMKYPPGILRFAESTGLTPSEVFNAHRMANNTATGDNKPLIAPTPSSIMVDAASPEMRKLFLSGEPSMIRRAGAQMSGDLGYTRQQRKTIDSFISMAGAAGAKFPELVAAQMILESATGTKLSGNNNFFGQKAGENEASTTKQTTEFRDGVERTETANFKNYSSPQESVNDLVNRWYKDYQDYRGVNNASSLEEAAMMLQQQNYATDPEYAQKLIQIANRFR